MLRSARPIWLSRACWDPKPHVLPVVSTMDLVAGSCVRYIDVHASCQGQELSSIRAFATSPAEIYFKGQWLAAMEFALPSRVMMCVHMLGDMQAGAALPGGWYVVCVRPCQLWVITCSWNLLTCMMTLVTYTAGFSVVGSCLGQCGTQPTLVLSREGAFLYPFAVI